MDRQHPRRGPVVPAAPPTCTEADGYKLFSPIGRVSRNRNGAVPVSVGLHAVAIGAALLASAAVAPELPPADPPPPAIPTLVVPVVRVVPVPPPPAKGSPRPTTSNRRVAAAPASSAPVVVSAPRVVVPIEEIDDPGSDVTFNTRGSGTGHGCLGLLCVGGGKGDGPEGDANATGDAPVRVSGLNAPQRIHFVAPRYPSLAAQVGLQGDVVVDCVIAPDGQVRDARVLSGHAMLHNAALDAVRQWRYSRPRLNDTPIAVLLSVTVHFRLQRR